MRHPFNLWLEAQELDVSSRTLFDEALRCYSVEAYRASLVFSYLGLLRTVAYRLMVSEAPVGFPIPSWEKIQRELRDDQLWEPTAFDSLMVERPASLFLIGADLRQELAYWRARRNDAAHAKSNEISAPHVEAFWLFVRSAFRKLIVAGGRNGLLERIRRHLDPSCTPKGADMFPLIAEIPQAVHRQDLRDFFCDLLVVTEDRDPGKGLRTGGPELTEEGDLVFRLILRLNDDHLLEAVAEELRSEKSLLIAALLGTPQVSALFARDKAFVRKLWHDLLPLKAQEMFHPIRQSLGVIVYMLRNGIIPDSEAHEALAHVVGKIEDWYPHEEYSDELLEALAPFGFWEAVHERAADYDPKVAWLAGNLWLSVESLSHVPLDARLARAFASLVPEGTTWDESYVYDSNFSESEDAWDFAMNFSSHPEWREELVRVSEADGIDIARLLSLIDQIGATSI